MSDQAVLQIDDIELILIRTKRRTLTLEIGAKGLVARAPLRMSQRAISQFVRQKRSWIDKQMGDRPAPIEPMLLQDGANVLYQGEQHRLNLLLGKRGKGKIEAYQISLPVKRSHLPIEQSTSAKLIKFLKAQALQTIEGRIAIFAEQMAVPENKLKGVKVRDYKRRWGSCDHLGRLSFNWRIIQAPAEVLDYVVVHELAHCHEFNHSKRFWRIVERQLPDWRERQNWLHQNGALLYRF